MPYFNTDVPELNGFDTGVCLANLALLEERQSRLSESLLAQLEELTDAILTDSGGDSDTLDSILLSLLWHNEEGEPFPLPPSVLPVNRNALERMVPLVGLHARLSLYTMLEKRLTGQKRDVKPTPAPVSGTAKGRVAYMPSTFADKAYLRLATCIPSPRASATAGFVDACEEVQSGLCQYCILPVENSHSGRLTAFTRLILRYRLRIVAVCDLEDGSAQGLVTRFALLTASDEDAPFPAAPFTEGIPLLEILHRGGATTLGELLAAAEFCGLTTVSIHTLPLPDGDMSEDISATVSDCVFSAENADLPAFYRYLSLEASEDLCAGLYTVIS